jgi:hypothetical protein
MKMKFAPWIIALILFAVPFFWLKPGEMDLGGDASRLYFYDPLRYLANYSLWSISPSGLGAENIGFMTIPLVALFAAVRSIISPTALISAFHGFSLSMAFIFVYLTMRQLLKISQKDQRLTETAALLSGLLYVLSPVSILGWDKVLMTHNYVFLNPFMFYLLLRYFLTDRFWYLLAALLATFIFSANFSFAAAPVFMAFYPVSLVFLFVYKRWILATGIRWKQLFAAGVAFIFLHAFHILPQVVSMMTPGSVLHTAVFSDQGKFDRGLGYFSAIAPSIKASVNLFILPQMTEFSKLLLFMVVVPLAVIAGFMIGKTTEKMKKTMILIGGSFLSVLFFATANITDYGLWTYKKLFVLPGFSIFRNFYGQWAGTYLFYYVLLFGVALSVILRTYGKVRIPLGVFLFFLIVNAWPFISGALTNPVLWQSDNVRIAMKMDPAFVKALAHLRQLPADGKVLTLPLTDPGYQIVAGKEEGGAYQGPSMIAYLAGRQDFAGYEELGRYKALILDLVKKKEYARLKNVLGLLNIKYIFYNADPRVYDAFPRFPYGHVRRFFPVDQRSYTAFVEDLNLKLVAAIDNRFFIYELNESNFRPTFFVAEKTLVATKTVVEMSMPLSIGAGGDSAQVFFEGDIPALRADTVLSPAEADSVFMKVVKNPDPPRVLHHSFATSSPGSFLYYPMIPLKEKIILRKHGDYAYRYLIDRRLFLSAKRIVELERWGQEIPVLGRAQSVDDVKKAFREPRIWDIIAWRGANSWEAILARYIRYYEDNIVAVESAPEPENWKAEQKFLMGEYLRQHRARILRIIRNLGKDGEEEEKEYLVAIVREVFAHLLDQAYVNIVPTDTLSLNYVLDTPQGSDGTYEVFVENKLFGGTSRKAISLKTTDTTLKAREDQPEPGWTAFDPLWVGGEKAKIPLTFTITNPRNLMEAAQRLSLVNIAAATDSASIRVDASFFRGQSELIWKLEKWQPQRYYLLSFEYQTSGDPFVVRVAEEEAAKRDNASINIVLEDQLMSPRWEKYQAVIRSKGYVDTALIQFGPGDSEASESNIEIKNMSLVHLPHPTIVLKKTSDDGDWAGTPPIITFTKINPTKYTVNVAQAAGPYTLVFNQQFNKGWRLSTGSVPGGHKKTVAQMSHFQANGFANAWYITPEDAGGRTDYELELYYTTQSYFYFGALLSTLTVIAVAGSGVFVWVKQLRT